MREIKLDPEKLKDMERRGLSLRQMVERHQARVAAEEALQALALAYREGWIAGGKEEAGRRMREKFEEINPPDQPEPE